MPNITKRDLLKNPWVQCPNLKVVNSLISNCSVQNFYRGTGYPTKRLTNLENKYRDWIKEIVDLKDLKYFYFVNGVTDAINQWCLHEKREWQFFKGDYEYPHAITGTGEKVVSIDPNKVLYISNPFCATGDFVDIENIETPVILDCAYVGATKKQEIKLPKNIEQVWFSFSKGWGLIGQRLGVVFSRYKIPSLEIMKMVECWNFNGVELAHLILDNFDPDSTFKMNMQKQQEICNDWDFEPSDCFFIAKSYKQEYKVRQRIPGVARIDLSKFFNEE